MTMGLVLFLQISVAVLVFAAVVWKIEEKEEKRRRVAVRNKRY